MDDGSDAATIRKALTRQSAEHAGRQLSAELDRVGISQGELARRLGVKASTVARYVTGDIVMNIHTVQRVARELGCDVATFFADDTDDEIVA